MICRRAAIPRPTPTVGYGPSVAVESTEIDPDADAWDYVFRVATSDPLPPLE